MATIFLGVRIPNRAYEHIQLENIDLEKPVDYLKSEISKKIDCPKDEIQLIFRGTILDDADKINDAKILPNSTIHVLKKTKKPKISMSNTTYTDDDCRRIANLFSSVTGTQLSVQTRIAVLQKVITEYPEFRRNLGAQALVRDSVLFNSLDKFEVIKKISKTYSVICDAAEFIVKTTKKELAKNQNDRFNEELFSSSSSEEENSSNPNQSEQARIRRISRDQLAAALMLAGSSSLNSLSNIAQRNANLTEQQQQERQQRSILDAASTSSNNSPSPSPATPGRITSSLFNSALTQALMNTTAQSSSSSSSSQLNPNDNSDQQQQLQQLHGMLMDTSSLPLNQSNEQRQRYANQLEIMTEMGLLNESLNLQALILTEGDVEAAINLVLAGINT